MIRKIKYIIYIFILLIVAMNILYLSRKEKKSIIVDNEATKDLYNFTEEEIKSYEEFNEKSMWTQITRFVEKNGNWSDIPLTKHFREKYNEKDGILGDIQFDTVEYFPYEEGTYPFTRTSYFVITQGKKKIAYNYNMYDVGVVIRDDGYRIGLVDDIELSSPIVFVDEDGNELDTRLRCTEENLGEIISIALDWNIDLASRVAVTDSFKLKYEDFTDIFYKKFKPRGEYHTIYKCKGFDAKKLTSDFYWISDEVEKLYRVYFILDDKQYIDDVEIEVLE